MRSCEDTDESVLTYAEIKALCAGNPLIKERIDLDIDVSRLRLLKAEYQSQHYKLEDNLLQYFPQSIEKTKEHIAGFKNDISRLESETKNNEDGFSPMEIGGVVYGKKGEAGAALLEACKQYKGKNKDNKDKQPDKIGSYRGFDMNLSFDSFNMEFYISLKGNMSYGTHLSTDTFGNITRINNTLADMPQRLISSEAQLENLCKQVENAKTELRKPFLYEQELAEKSERLALIDSKLNMDGSIEATDEIPEIDDDIPRREASKSFDKPSIQKMIREYESPPFPPAGELNRKKEVEI